MRRLTYRCPLREQFRDHSGALRHRGYTAPLAEMAESELDTKRVSLLDVINSKRQAAGEPAEIVTRVTCVAKLTDNLTSHRANTLSGA